MSKALKVCSVAALVLSALSLGPSFAHVLEAPPRLMVWSPELWRDATVFNGQFRLFALVGAPIDLGAILAAAILAGVLRKEREPFRWALAGAVLLTLGLVVWFGWVAPANSVLATWVPGPIPDDFNAVRHRWETGHMAVAALKLIGFIAIVLSVVRTSR
ncbi:DUF1772 domain-containing protein [Microvirga aerophila]|uniref:DUF1772 domain-containing protein n=1 Tax=Microvirga aerophila TaxID=670291 RepID=A0A512BT65_9HYPH|nr:DUF1772 domain-containing protein [Microvirga aerophila]GEO15189.1 hypothetical protein MAE02_28850 [Microvirga aerophila]